MHNAWRLPQKHNTFTMLYESKSGQKWVTQMPYITKDILTIINSKYQTDLQQIFMKDIQEMINEMTEQMKTNHK